MSAIDPREVARWVRLITANRLIPGAWSADGRWVNAARDGGPGTKGGISFGGADFCTAAPALVDALMAAPTLPAAILSDALDLDPLDLARALHGADDMTTQCPLFVELCAGTAALSLRLHAGRNARPPVSRMGAKTGYADVILRCLGLRPGQGHTDGTRYLWCEPDAGVRLLLHAYTDRALATAAAEIIRSWKDEDPRALWERLRAEGSATCPEGLTAREVARWLTVAATSRPGAWAGGFRGEHKHRHNMRGWYPEPALLSRRLGVSGIPAAIHPDARAIDPPTLPPGTVAYMDPPYLNTTGYAHDLGRDEVVRIARRWADAGALVCISEAEPIPKLVGDGWHKVEVTGERKGQRRTFSKQQAEWLTMSRPPAWVPSVQAPLFGAA